MTSNMSQLLRALDRGASTFSDGTSLDSLDDLRNITFTTEECPAPIMCEGGQ